MVKIYQVKQCYGTISQMLYINPNGIRHVSDEVDMMRTHFILHGTDRNVFSTVPSSVRGIWE